VFGGGGRGCPRSNSLFDGAVPGDCVSGALGAGLVSSCEVHLCCLALCVDGPFRFGVEDCDLFCACYLLNWICSSACFAVTASTGCLPISGQRLELLGILIPYSRPPCGPLRYPALERILVAQVSDVNISPNTAL